MTSIDELKSYLEKLDPKGLARGTAYSKTFNASLGLDASDPFSMCVFMPWSNWQTYDTWAANQQTFLPSPLEEAFREVATAGHTGNDGVIDTSVSFPDKAHLNEPGYKFMTEFTQTSTETAVGPIFKLAELVNSMDPNITPVIRFLAGGTQDSPRS